MRTLIALLAFASISAPAAPTLHCEPNYMEDRGVSGITSFVYDAASFDCNVKNSKDQYHIEMRGIGAGLRIEGEGGSYRLVCPLVRKKKLVGGFVGAKISAGFFSGGDVAVLTNKTLGVCFLYGVTLEQVGASVSVDYMKITKDN